MKKVLFTLMCITAMLATGTSLKAQEVTIVLMPGWTWISIPSTDTLDFATALGSFTPEVGDLIASQWGNAVYMSNGQWRGSVSQFYPGYGYKYKSTRTVPVTLTFNAQQPAPQVVVTTTEPTDITTTSTVVGGIVTIGEGNHIFARGVCWGTESNPTIDDSYQAGDNVAGSQSFTLNNLTIGTTYYVRAYVVSDYGLAYGEEQSFTTLENSSNIPEGAINGLFTINVNGDQVYFSQGNLQYIGSAATPYWKFADHQWDYIGDAQIGTSEMLDRDLFGWGTSGYNHGAICYQPWNTSYTNSQYYAYGDWQYSLYDQTGQADWGYNAIVNGGDVENNGWRTLTTEEWVYVLTIRSTSTVNGVANARFAKAVVADIYGLIMFPDTYEHPFGVVQPIGINETGTGWNGSNYTAMDFALMEANGAIFLPSAGDRSGTSYLNNDHFDS